MRQYCRAGNALEKFQGKAGLYALGAQDIDLNLEDRLEYIPMHHPECLPGELFLFRGWFFIIYLGSGGIDEMMLPGPLPFGAIATGGVNIRPLFHLKGMNFAVQNRKSHVIRFKW